MQLHPGTPPPPRTPTLSHSKTLHTPPSTASSSSPRQRGKFLRALSGKVFRRDSQSGGQAVPHLGGFPLAPPAQFTPLGGGTPATATPLRSHVPKPLSLGSPVSLPRSTGLSRSTSRSTAATHPNPQWLGSPRDLTGELSAVAEAPQAQAQPGMDAPLLAPLVPRLSSGARRELHTAACAVCGDPAAVSLAGEKCVELHCGHAVHFECYCALLGVRGGLGPLAPSPTGAPPCGVCGDAQGPRESATLAQLEAAAVLTTPLEQVIQPGDVGSQGFCSPGEVPVSPARHSGSGGSATVSFEGLDDAIYDEILRLTEDGGGVETGVLRDSDTDVGSPPPQEAPVGTAEPPVLSVHSSQDGTVTVTALDNDTPTQGDLSTASDPEEESALRHDLTVHFAAELGDTGASASSTGPLLLLDSVHHSLDGAAWDMSQGHLLFCFSRALVLQDPASRTVSGRVPLDQLSSATVLPDGRTLLLCLKSTTLPELYLRFAQADRARLWQRTLQEAGDSPLPPLSALAGPPGLTQLPLPVELLERVAAVAPLDQPAVPSPEHTPARIILCVDVSAQSGVAAQAALDVALSALGPGDLLGMVLVGRNGAGEPGPYGTFVGMLPPGWPGWRELELDTDSSSGGPVFPDGALAAETMLETCRRLAATVPAAADPQYYSRVILLQAGEDSSSSSSTAPAPALTPIAQRHAAKVAQQGFDVRRVASTAALTHSIAECRRTRVYDLTLDLGGKTHGCGSLAPGAHHSFTLALAPGAFRNRVCDAAWWDIPRQRHVSQTLQVTLD